MGGLVGLAGRLVSGLVNWLGGWLVSWWVGWSVSWWVGWFGWSDGRLVSIRRI